MLSNCDKRSFCSCERLIGVSTCTEHIKSPTPPPLTGLIPFPFNLNKFPVWVPAGISIETLLLASVGISISAPNAASAKKEIGILQ